MQSDALVEALKKEWVDLAIIESYPYVAGDPAWTPELAAWRLGNAKKAGIMEKAIPAFWIDPEDQTFTEQWLEGWVTRWRTEFPEMPGLAPLFPKGHDTTDPRARHLAEVCDRLIGKHYVGPAPAVEFMQPQDGAVLDGNPVDVRAQASKPTAKWRLYVDAQLVASVEGDGNQVTRFSPISLSPGLHALTVQAIDEAWARGAAQIVVDVVAQNPAQNRKGKTDGK
jgi:hypothetical protein